MRVAALVLAAGASTRFGAANKLLAPYAGKPLARHAAEAVAALDVVLRIAVVSDPLVRALFDGFAIAELAEAEGGQSASIRAGLELARAAQATRLLVVLADMPRVSPRLLRQVIEASDETSAAAATDGERAMPPACFPEVLFSRLAALAGDAGARSIIGTLPPARLIHAPAELIDIDRVADLTSADPGRDAPPPPL